MFNFAREDPSCANPYPSYSDYPSKIVKNGECIPWSIENNKEKEYVKFFIIDSSGNEFDFRETENSPVIPNNFKAIGEKDTAEWKLSNGPDADACIIDDFDFFTDASC